jgi:hypothetical protein
VQSQSFLTTSWNSGLVPLSQLEALKSGCGLNSEVDDLMSKVNDLKRR